jgi:hypothetical protein
VCRRLSDECDTGSSTSALGARHFAERSQRTQGGFVRIANVRVEIRMWALCTAVALGARATDADALAPSPSWVR